MIWTARATRGSGNTCPRGGKTAGPRVEARLVADARVGAFLVGCAGVLAFLGCIRNVRSSFFDRPPSDGDLRCIAVLPFNNITDFPEAGTIAPELIAVELYRSRRFNVLESSEVERILERRGVALENHIDNETAGKIGRTLGVDGVIVGSVNDYGFRNLSSKARAIPVAGVQVVLLDVRKGGVLWSGEAWDDGFDLSLSHRMPLNEVVQRVMHKLLRPLLSEIPERDLDHREVCWAEAGTITLVKKVEEAPQARPVPRLGRPQREFYDLLLKDKSRVLDGVGFKPGGIALSPASIASLQALGPALKAVLDSDPTLRLRFEGHCDSMESDAGSREISLRRAERVKEFFVRNFSLPSERIEAAGAGSGKPVMPNTTARGRGKNRRVEVFALFSRPAAVR